MEVLFIFDKKVFRFSINFFLFYCMNLCCQA